MPAIYVWLLVIMLIAVVSVYSMQLAVKAREESGDTGPAILAFGKAFPKEAIRDVIATADEGTVFMRLFDGKVGCVRYHGRAMSCRILKPDTVTVLPGRKQNAVQIDFRNSRADSGEFVFSNARQAAEVSLWLLGSLVARDDETETLNPA